MKNHKTNTVLCIQHTSEISGSLISHLQTLKSLDQEAKKNDRHYYFIIICKHRKMLSHYLSAGYREVYYFPWIVQIGHCSGLTYNLSTFRGSILLIKHLFFFIPSILFQMLLFLRFRPHLIYLNSSTLLSSSIAAWILFIPSLIHIRETLQEGRWGIRKFFFSKFIPLFSKKMIFISPHEQSTYSSYQDDKKEMIMNPFGDIEFSKIYHAAISTPPIHFFKILTLGGINPLKDTLILLKSILQCSDDKPIEVTILGDMDALSKLQHKKDPLFSYYQEVHHTISLFKETNHQIIIIGESSNVSYHIQNSHLLFFGTPFPHFPRPIYEAFFLRCPVLTCTSMAIYELFDRENCFLTERTINNISKNINLLYQKFQDHDFRYHVLTPMLDRAYQQSLRMSNAYYQKKIYGVFNSIQQAH
jgi:hypothetical protein